MEWSVLSTSELRHLGIAEDRIQGLWCCLQKGGFQAEKHRHKCIFCYFKPRAFAYMLTLAQEKDGIKNGSRQVIRGNIFEVSLNSEILLYKGGG